MRKFLSIVAILFTATVSQAFQGQTVCQDPIVESDEYLVCTKQGEKFLIDTNRMHDLPKLEFPTVDHLELGFPDDSTNMIYSYYKAVYNLQGRHIGYANIFGIVNSEGGWRVKITVFYDLKENVVAAKAESF